MFRLWGKLYKDNRIIQDIVICNEDTTISFQELVDNGLEEICMLFDLQKPFWLNDNRKDLLQFKRASFNKSHFIEYIEFDYLEIEIIEEHKQSDLTT